MAGHEHQQPLVRAQRHAGGASQVADGGSQAGLEPGHAAMGGAGAALERGEPRRVRGHAQLRRRAADLRRGQRHRRHDLGGQLGLLHGEHPKPVLAGVFQPAPQQRLLLRVLPLQAGVLGYADRGRAHGRGDRQGYLPADHRRVRTRVGAGARRGVRSVPERVGRPVHRRGLGGRRDGAASVQGRERAHCAGRGPGAVRQRQHGHRRAAGPRSGDDPAVQGGRHNGGGRPRHRGYRGVQAGAGGHRRGRTGRGRRGPAQGAAVQGAGGKLWEQVEEPGDVGEQAGRDVGRAARMAEERPPAERPLPEERPDWTPHEARQPGYDLLGEQEGHEVARARLARRRRRRSGYFRFPRRASGRAR